MGCKFTNQENYTTESNFGMVSSVQEQQPISREVHLSQMTKFMKLRQQSSVNDSLMILQDPIDQMTISIQEGNEFTSMTTIMNMVQYMNSEATKDLFKPERSSKPLNKNKKKRRTKINMDMLEQEF